MIDIVDFHSHVLPGIDDGSRSVEESIAMLRREAAQGIRRVIATPHFYPRHDTPERFLERRREAEIRLREEMAKHRDLPEVICGAEVYYFPGICECDALPGLTIGEKRYILIEMPQAPWSGRMYAELEEIQCRWGITPVIAHVDRYLGVFRDYGIPGQLEQLPVLVQANAGFFLHSATQGKALRMLKKDRIHLLGSDCHNMSSRPPNLDQALDVIGKKLPQEILDRIGGYQMQVLSGK